MARRMAEVSAAGLPWLVAERSGVVTGYARATPWRPRSAYRFSAESTIYLDPQHTGAGLGTQLYRELLLQLKSRSLHVAIGGVALPNPAERRAARKARFPQSGALR